MARKLLIMVRPERFELPTLWFEAKCSIQLSYGRVWLKLSKNSAGGKSGGWCLGWCRGRRWVEHGERFDDVEAGAAEELVDDGLGEAGGVVFDADGAGGLVEGELADTVDLADAGDGQGSGLRGLRSVAVEDV
jgi:hypothetical protein